MDAGVRQADDTAEQTASEPASASYGVWQRTRADFTRMRRARVHWRTPGMLSVVLYTILAQALIAVLIGPLLQFLFSTALETAGLDGFELPRVGALLGSPAPVALLIALVVIALATVSLQLCLIVFVVDLVRHGQRPTPRRVWQLLRCIPGVISHGAAGGLFGYVFVILPLAGFGAFSMLTRAISIPPFITGELEKTTAGSVALIVLFVVIWYANIRFALTIPLLVSAASKRLDLVSNADTVAGGAVGSGAERRAAKSARINPMTGSWRRTRGRSLAVFGAFATVAIVSALIALGAVTSALLLTAAADVLAPTWADEVAAITLSVAQVVNLVQLSLSAGVFASMLLCLAHDPISGPGIEPQTEIAGDAAVRPLRIRSRVGLWLGLCGLGLVLLLVTANLTVVRALQTAPATQILGHRGDSDGGVENTIAGLDAAKAAGVDRVEMDVMETTDSKFVVMHDANLQRLADLDADVFDLTQEELTQIQVHDQLGHTETIPTFEEYVAHAQRIGMPLLIELKLHGHEHDAYMERFIAVLDEVNGFQDNIFHSLDRQRVEELKRARPGARVGYIMPFAALRLPATTADFYVLEQFSNTDDLMRQAHDAGKQYFIWTVDSTRAADDLMAQGVDALIVEHSADMVAERADREDKIVPAAQALMNAFDRNLTLL